MATDLQFVVHSATPLFFPLLAVVGAAVHSRRRPGAALEVWQRWWLVCAVGCGASWVGISFLIAPDYMAETIGFATGSPFQFEIAFANLGFAVSGIALAFRQSNARLIFGIGYGIFLWGATIGHLHEWFNHDNHRAGNTGGILIYDIAIPAVIVFFALAAQRQRTYTRALVQ